MVSRIVLFLFVFFCYSITSAQESEKIDSLKKVLTHEKKDSARIDILLSIADEFSFKGEYNDAMHYCNLALKKCDSALSIKYNSDILYLKGQIFDEYGTVNFNQGKNLESIDDFKRAVTIFTQLKKTSDIAMMYNSIANSYFIEGKFLMAIENQQKGINFAKRSKNRLNLGDAQKMLADIYSETGEINNAIKYYSFAINSFVEAKGYFELAEVYGELGNLYADIGNFKKAIEYHNKSIKIFEHLSDKNGLTRAYNSMGCRYLEQNDNDQAIKYFNKSLSVANEITEKYSVALALKNIGVVLKNKKQYKQSLSYLQRSLMVSNSIGSENLYGMTLNDMGNTYQAIGKIDSALWCYFEGYKIMQETNDGKGIASAQNSIGTIYVKQKKFKDAESFCSKSFQRSQKLGNAKTTLESAEQLSIIYENQNRFKEAYKMYQIYKKLCDSINSRDAANALLNYETEKKLLLIKQNQEKKETKIYFANQKKIEQKNYWIYGSFGLLLLVIVSGVSVYKVNKQKQTAKTMVLEQKLLRSQMNPHFIFNILASIQNIIYKDKKEDAHVYVGKFAKLMRSILENSREEFVSMEKEIKTLEHYLSLNQLLLDNKFNFKIEIDKNIDIEHTQIPPMLAQPFIENALKHGIQNKEAPGSIKVAFKQIDTKNIQFEVEDNGIGFTKIITPEKIEHKSFATTITQERLVNLYNNKNVVISITEVRNKLNEITGTKTFFTIPYREI